MEQVQTEAQREKDRFEEKMSLVSKRLDDAEALTKQYQKELLNRAEEIERLKIRLEAAQGYKAAKPPVGKE
jgi:hypothetical protein